MLVKSTSPYLKICKLFIEKRCLLFLFYLQFGKFSLIKNDKAINISKSGLKMKITKRGVGGILQTVLILAM